MPSQSISYSDPSFWALVKKTRTCWLWSGARNNSGYGIFKSELAHRLIFATIGGPIPDGAYVCHRCDVPWCVRPTHLFLGDAQANSRDMYRKGRYPHDRPYHPEAYPRGSTWPSSKLTAEAAQQIRRRFDQGETNKSALAREFGVSSQAIIKLLRGDTWRYLLST